MPKLGCQLFRAKELLIGVLHTAESRNRRAHSETMEHTMPSEAEALDAMQQMGDVLAQCNCNVESDHMRRLLSSTQQLVERAREADRDGSTQPPRAVSISRNAWEKLVRYRALFDFENRLRATAGEFHFMNGSISFGIKQDGTIVNSWGREQKERIQGKDIKPRLRRIAHARNSLFHVMLEGTTTLVDDLNDMGTVLHRLANIKDGVPTTVGCSTPT